MQYMLSPKPYLVRASWVQLGHVIEASGKNFLLLYILPDRNAAQQRQAAPTALQV
jgi:hypothetical protein